MNTKTKSNTLTTTNAKAKRASRKATLPETVLAPIVEEFEELVPADTTPLGFEFTPYAKSLLRRSIENVRENTGKNIDDETARTDVENRAAILEATNGDLAMAITAIAEVCGTERETSTSIYSLVYQIGKASVFLANIDLRRWLDPNADTDKTPRADLREDTREAPYGLGPDHPDTEFSDNTIYSALKDINVFLSTMAEAFGWENDNGMPYACVRDDAGKYHNIYDAEHALDVVEKARQLRMSRMREQRAVTMGKAAAKARQLMLAITREALKA